MLDGLTGLAHLDHHTLPGIIASASFPTSNPGASCPMHVGHKFMCSPVTLGSTGEVPKASLVPNFWNCVTEEAAPPPPIP